MDGFPPQLRNMQIIENGNIHTYEELTPEKRPQDRPRDGTCLMFTTIEHGGEYPDSMPQALRVRDSSRRSVTYIPQQTVDGRVADPDGKPLPAEMRPQDEDGRGRDLAFTPLSWGGDYPDDMPEKIELRDREGRFCIYEPIRVNGRAVDSKGFYLPPPGQSMPELQARV